MLFVFLIFFPTALANYFILTDLHFDIAYNGSYNQTYVYQKLAYLSHNQTTVPTENVQPLVRPFCDSSLALINSTLLAMVEIDPNPEFILVLGDSIGHYTSRLIQPNGVYNSTQDVL